MTAMINAESCSPELISLYKEIAKIGIPGLIGLLAGLAPYFIERHKSSAKITQEKIKHQQDKANELVSCISAYMGSFRTLINIQLSNLDSNEPVETFDLKIDELTLESNCLYAKAKLILVTFNSSELLESFTLYDQKLSELLNSAIDTSQGSVHKKLIGELTHQEYVFLSLLSKHIQE